MHCDVSVCFDGLEPWDGQACADGYALEPMAAAGVVGTCSEELPLSSSEVNLLKEEGRSLLPKLQGVDLKISDRLSAVNALLDRLESDAPCKDRATIRRTFRRAWSVLAHEWNSCSDALKALQDVMAEREDEARCAAVDPSDALKFLQWLFPGSQTSCEMVADQVGLYIPLRRGCILRWRSCIGVLWE